MLIAPYLLVFAFFVLYPVGYGLWLARAPQNYVALYHDPIFASAAINTLIFLVIGINIKMAIALFLSGFFIQTRWWIRWLSVLFILPWAVPSIPTILSVRFMLNPEWGMVNQLIFKLTGEDGPNWLNDPTIGLSMAIAVHIWKSLPFWTLILMTGGSRFRRICSKPPMSMVPTGGRNSASSPGRRCRRCISPARCSR